MTIFVTGGAGYIGSHTVIKLLENGYDVIVADNFSNSKPEAVKRIKEIAGKEFLFYEMDVCNTTQLDKIFTENKIDCVIHFAGLKAVGESVEKPLDYYANNLNSTISLCNTMKNHDVTKFIFSSSATVYSAENAMPLTEESRTGECINPYGWTKYMCEQILTDAVNANSGWAVASLRYFNPIGAHESGRIGEDPQDIPNNIMPFIAQTAVGKFKQINVKGTDYDTPDGTCIRDYIHVVDLAEGHVTVINYLNNHTGVSVFNLGTGRGVSVLELISAFEQATGVEIKKENAQRRPGDLPVSFASTDKAKKILGWEAKKTIKEACADSWHWQKTNPNGYNVFDSASQSHKK